MSNVKNQNNPAFRNEVILIGKIINIYKSEKTTFMTIRTYKGKPNAPQVRFYADLFDEASKFSVGDFVTVKGRIASIKRGEDTVKWPNQFIVGNEIEATAPIMETEFKQSLSNRPHYPSENAMYVTGRIVHASRPAENVQNYLIYTEANGRVSIIQLTQYVDPNSKSLAKGDNVNLYGTVQTSRKEKDGEPVFYTNFIISEIQKIS